MSQMTRQILFPSAQKKSKIPDHFIRNKYQKKADN